MAECFSNILSIDDCVQAIQDVKVRRVVLKNSGNHSILFSSRMNHRMEISLENSIDLNAAG